MLSGYIPHAYSVEEQEMIENSMFELRTNYCHWIVKYMLWSHQTLQISRYPVYMESSMPQALLSYRALSARATLAETAPVWCSCHIFSLPWYPLIWDLWPFRCRGMESSRVRNYRSVTSGKLHFAWRSTITSRCSYGEYVELDMAVCKPVCLCTTSIEVYTDLCSGWCQVSRYDKYNILQYAGGCRLSWQCFCSDVCYLYNYKRLLYFRIWAA